MMRRLALLFVSSFLVFVPGGAVGAQAPTPTPPATPEIPPTSPPPPRSTRVPCGLPGSGCRIVCEGQTPTPTWPYPTWTPLPRGTPTLTPTVTPSPTPTPTPRPELTKSIVFEFVVYYPVGSVMVRNYDVVGEYGPVVVGDWVNDQGAMNPGCGLRCNAAYFRIQVPVSYTAAYAGGWVSFDSSLFHWPRSVLYVYEGVWDASGGRWRVNNAQGVSVQATGSLHHFRRALTVGGNCHSFTIRVAGAEDKAWYHQPGSPVYCWDYRYQESPPIPLMVEGSRGDSGVLWGYATIPVVDGFADSSGEALADGLFSFGARLGSYSVPVPTPTPTPAASPTPTRSPRSVWRVWFSNVQGDAQCWVGSSQVPCGSVVSGLQNGASASVRIRGLGSGEIWVENVGDADGVVSVSASIGGAGQVCVPPGCYPANSFSGSYPWSVGRADRAVGIQQSVAPSGQELAVASVVLGSAAAGGDGGGGSVSPTPTTSVWPGCENLPPGCRCVMDSPRIEPVPSVVDCFWLIPSIQVPGLGNTPGLKACFVMHRVVLPPFVDELLPYDLSTILAVLAILAAYYILFKVVTGAG